MYLYCILCYLNMPFKCASLYFYTILGVFYLPNCFKYIHYVEYIYVFIETFLFYTFVFI